MTRARGGLRDVACVAGTMDENWAELGAWIYATGGGRAREIKELWRAGGFEETSQGCRGREVGPR